MANTDDALRLLTSPEVERAMAALERAKSLPREEREARLTDPTSAEHQAREFLAPIAARYESAMAAYEREQQQAIETREAQRRAERELREALDEAVVLLSDMDQHKALNAYSLARISVCDDRANTAAGRLGVTKRLSLPDFGAAAKAWGAGGSSTLGTDRRAVADEILRSLSHGKR